MFIFETVSVGHLFYAIFFSPLFVSVMYINNFFHLHTNDINGLQYNGNQYKTWSNYTPDMTNTSLNDT